MRCWRACCCAPDGTQAVDNNLHFYGNLLSKSCTLVVDGANLAEIHFPTVSNQDLMVAGQSAHLPVVFKLKDCKGPAEYNVKVTLSGTEDSEQPGFLASMTPPPRRGWGLVWKLSMERGWILTTQLGRPSRLSTVTMSINFRAWIQAKSGRDVTIGEFTASLTRHLSTFNMKILRWLFALVMLMTATEALAAGHSVQVYYGTNGDMRSSMIFSLEIVMPSAVYDGGYKSP